MTRKRRVVVTRRQVARAAAREARLTPEQFDQALVLGQLAELLAQDSRLGHSSPRMSADLDVAVRSGRPVHAALLKRVLRASTTACADGRRRR